MIRVTLVPDHENPQNSIDLWQEGGAHWAAGTVLDALLSDKKYDRIIIDPNSEFVPSFHSKQ